MEGENASGCGRDSGGVGSSIRKEVVGGGGGEVEERRREAAEGRMRTEGDLCIPLKVMTDEQIEVLRQQIAIYATISEQLIQMHKTLSAQQESFTGMRLGSLYIDSLMVPGGHKLTPRQRWTPTNMHLHMLESIFKQGHGTPSKQKIKEITLELSQHGQISETNVYNWFQNRRARSKRKQAATAVPQSNAETEVGEQVQFPPNDQKFNQQINNDESFSPFMNYDMHPSDAPEHSLQTHGFYQPNYASRLSEDSGRVSYFENVLPNHRLEQFAGGMDITGSFSPFHSEGFDMMD